jgi:hypothetical protein
MIKKILALSSIWGPSDTNREELFVIRQTCVGLASSFELNVVIPTDNEFHTKKDGALNVTGVVSEHPGSWVKFYILRKLCGQITDMNRDLLLETVSFDIPQISKLLKAFNPDHVLIFGLENKLIMERLNRLGVATSSIPMLYSNLYSGFGEANEPVNSLLKNFHRVLTYSAREGAWARKYNENVIEIKMWAPYYQSAVTTSPIKLPSNDFILLECDSIGLHTSDILMLSKKLSPLPIIAFDTKNCSVFERNSINPGPPAGTSIDKLRLLARAKVFVNLKQISPCGLRTLQALRYGIPTICWDDSVSKDYLESSNAGLWFSEFPQIALGCEKILDPQLNNYFRQNAIKWANNNVISAEAFPEQFKIDW